MKNIFIIKFIVLATSLICFLAQSASYNSCDGEPIEWNSDTSAMYINTISMPVGGAWNLQTQYMMSEWNSVGDSNFDFTVGATAENSVTLGNGKSEIAFVYAPSEDYLGVAFTRWNCYTIFGSTISHYTEADIHINTKWVWSTADFTGTGSSTSFSFPLVMLHELGHSLGLNHQNNVIATMNQYYYNGGPNGYNNKEEPHADDRTGVRYLYPTYDNDHEVSASKYKNSGGSSLLNTLKTTSGSSVTAVSKSLSYDLEYTAENLGTETESVNIKFYLSTNTLISTADTYLASTTWSMPKGTNVSTSKRITIPSNIASGTYYIGYKVDANNSIEEINESNNYVSLYAPIYIN